MAYSHCRKKWQTNAHLCWGCGILPRIWEKAVKLLPGDTVTIPANAKHWHGASQDSWFSHLAFEIPGEKINTEWHEAVSDDDYLKAQQ